MIFQSLLLDIFRAILQSYYPNDAVTSLVWALPRSLATTWGIIFYFLFLRVLRCFSSPRSLTTLVVRLSFRQPGCPIRKFTNQRLFAPPRDLSQLITSFIACKSLGIHRTPFLTCLPRRICCGRCLLKVVRSSIYNFLFIDRCLPFLLVLTRSLF